MLRTLIACCLAAGAAGCVGDAYRCDQDSQCQVDGVAGSCEANRLCSFPDAICPSGRRYGEFAGGVSRQCVSPDGDVDGGVVDLADADLATPANSDLATGNMDLATTPPDLASCTIAFRAATTAYLDPLGATSISLTLPTGAVAGDLLLAGIFWGSTNNTTLPPMTPPAGWTLLRRTDADPVSSLSIYYKIAGAGEPSSYSFSMPNSNSAAAWMAAYSGVNNATPIDTDNGQAFPNNSNTYTAPAVTTTLANDLVVVTIGGYDNTAAVAWLAPTGTTLRKQLNNMGAKSIVFGDEQRASAGLVPAASATASDTLAYAIAEELALRCR